MAERKTINIEEGTPVYAIIGSGAGKLSPDPGSDPGPENIVLALTVLNRNELHLQTEQALFFGFDNLGQAKRIMKKIADEIDAVQEL